MIIGIMSDNHDHPNRVRAALGVLDDAGAEYIIHCGDVCGMAPFDSLAGRPCTFVWGNCDEPSPKLETYVQSLGLTLPDAIPQCVTLDGKTIAVFHGHERAFNNTIAHPETDYIMHGHTHERRDDRIGNTRIINPGALHRATPLTVATLDLKTDTLTFHEVHPTG